MNKKLLLVIAILVILTVGTVFIIQRETISPPPIILLPEHGDASDIAEANNQFAIDYYNKLVEGGEENIFFSPFSISNAFAMVYEGAEGQTAEEMRSVFHFPKDNNLMRGGYASLLNELNKENKKYELHSANALWAQKDYRFSQAYLDTVEQYYKGKVTNVDFKKESEKSRITINNWVEDKTNNRIKDLLSSESISEETKLVLINAIYFKGEWVREFSEEDTRRENFRTVNQGTVEAEMMRRLDEESIFNYAENDILQILEMPYSGDDLSVLFLLPKNDDLTRLENSLSTSNILKWKEEMKEQRVDLYIPKFKLETGYSMKDDLKSMGMPLAFSNSAEFFKMTAKDEIPLSINEAVHKAFVEMNEQGTEAAAATAIGMAPTSFTQTPLFKADHPFIFLIQHNSTGNILFMGRVVNPEL